MLAFLGKTLEIGVKSSDVAKGFSSSMFVTLVGVTFLFGMASQNGTLDLFSKRTCLLTQASPFMKADCSAPLVLPQSSPAFAIRAIALLAHTGLPSDTREFAHASMAHSRLPSGTFIVINSCAAGLLPL